MNAPCHKCTERYAECHSHCKRYREWKDDNEKKRAIIREIREQDGAMYEHRHASYRKSLKKKGKKV